MSSTKEFPIDYVIGTGVDYGSINNSPDHFNVILYSNDKHVERVTEEASVRARFRTKMITPFNFKGPWQVRLQELSVRNEQSMVLQTEVIKKSTNTVVTQDPMPRRVYENMFDVYEQTVHQMSKNKVDADLSVLDDETFSIIMYTGNYDWTIMAEPIRLGPIKPGQTTVHDLWKHFQVRNSMTDNIPTKVIKETSLFIPPKDSNAKTWPANRTWQHNAMKANQVWKKHRTHKVLRARNPSDDTEFIFFPDRDKGKNFAIICSERLLDALRVRKIKGLGTVPVSNSKDLHSFYVTKPGPFNIVHGNQPALRAPVMRSTSPGTYKVQADHLIRLKNERGQEIDTFEGTWSLQKDDTSMEYLLDPSVLHPHKLDLFDIRIEELQVLEKEFSCEGKKGESVAELRDNVLVDSLYIPKDCEFFTYRENRRGFKRIKDTRNVTSLTVTIESVESPNKTPWFHTGFTKAILEFRRDWSELPAEIEG